MPVKHSPTRCGTRRARICASAFWTSKTSARSCWRRTADGRALEVAANVASAEEVAIAIGAGAQGVGLFRTEMLFMDRSAPPNEQEQTGIYTDAVAAAGGRPIIIRLLDIGGDKPAPY